MLVFVDTFIFSILITSKISLNTPLDNGMYGEMNQGFWWLNFKVKIKFNM